MKKSKDTPKDRPPTGRAGGRSGGKKKESYDSVDSRGTGLSDLPNRRSGETARDWDSWPTSPFGPNGASDI